MGSSSGITAKAFDELSKSSSFQLNKSLNELGVLFTEVGAVLLQTLLPVFKDIGNFVKDVTIKFNSLSPEVKKFGVIVAGIVAILPPLMIALGSLVTGLGLLLTPVGAVVIALGGLIVFFDDIANAFIYFRITVKTFLLNTLIRIEEFFKKYLFTPLKTAKRLISEFADKKFSGDFGGIIEDMFAEQDEISLDAGKRIAENYVKGAEEGLAKFKKGRISDLVNDLFEGTLNTFSGLGTPTTGGSSVTDTTTTPTPDFQTDFNKVKPAIHMLRGTTPSFAILNDKLQQAAESYKSVEEQRIQKIKDAEASYLSFGEAVTGILEQSFMALMSGENPFQGLMQHLKALAARLLATAAAAAILAALTGGSFGKGMAAVSKVQGLMTFGGAAASFAKGGIVSGPTLALVGDNTGAGRGNPEVIAPLNKLQGMIDAKSNQQINVGGEFRLEGQDLVLALQRADRERNRIN